MTAMGLDTNMVLDPKNPPAWGRTRMDCSVIPDDEKQSKRWDDFAEYFNGSSSTYVTYNNFGKAVADLWKEKEKEKEKPSLSVSVNGPLARRSSCT